MFSSYKMNKNLHQSDSKANDIGEDGQSSLVKNEEEEVVSAPEAIIDMKST